MVIVNFFKLMCPNCERSFSLTANNATDKYTFLLRDMAEKCKHRPCESLTT